MSRDLLSNETPDITSEACAWIAQLETGALTAADLDAFREWMRRSPRHAAEIKRLARISKDLNVLTEMADCLQEPAARYQPILKKTGSRWSRFKPLNIAALAAATAIVVIVTYFLVPGKMVPRQSMQVATSIGDYREIKLPDGTLVKLNTASRIEVQYDSSQRSVHLLAGEAFFNVKADPDRPFLVYANGKYVRAVGTAFVVRLLEEKFEVTVVEGKVEVADNSTENEDTEGSEGPGNKAGRGGDASVTPSTPVILEAGQSISIPARGREFSRVTLSARDLQRELSWQEGLHDFSNTPLEDVVKEISRYSPLEIEIADAELRHVKFGGIFRIGETQPLFDALHNSFGIKVEYIDNNKVRLSLAAQE